MHPLCSTRCRFKLDIRKHFFTGRVVRCWHSCLGQWWSRHPWRCSKAVWMWHLGTWVGGFGNAGLRVGLNDLKGLFQMKKFHDSVILLLSAVSPATVPSMLVCNTCPSHSPSSSTAACLPLCSEIILVTPLAKLNLLTLGDVGEG